MQPDVVNIGDAFQAASGRMGRMQEQIVLLEAQVIGLKRRIAELEMEAGDAGHESGDVPEE